MLTWISLSSIGAYAQTRPDQEYRESEAGKEDKLTVTGLFETDYYEYDNLDFRKLDETSDQSILDSDDRGAFAFSGASLNLGYQVDPQIQFVLAAGHRGLWGDDQIGSVNEYGGFLYLSGLYTDLSTAPENGVRFRVGRQFFSIGGLGSAKDFVLADVLDMVRVDVPLGSVGTWTLIPINVFSVASEYNEVDFVGLLGQQNAETFEFGGQTLTRRYGTVLSLPELPGPIDATAYAFFADVGARGTGADISYAGQLGNFSDNDWVANFGVRALGTFGPVQPFLHFDASSGIDRKELVAQDVDCNGFAYGAGVRVDTRKDGLPAGFVGELSYFDALGGAYSQNGLQRSHGYVGMKGQQVGGTLFNRFMGWHPSAYLGRNGVSDTPQDLTRIAGTRSIHAEAGYTLSQGLGFWAGYWFLQDTGFSELQIGQLDQITPPYGYSRSEFKAQERLARSLGQEIDLELRGYVGTHVQLYANGAVVMPGQFQSFVEDRQAGSMLGSPDPAMPWSAYAGARVTW